MLPRVDYTFGMSPIEGRETVRNVPGITSFTLKIIAIIGMTCNHLAWILSDALPFALLCTLEGAGGLTFPIMAFLLAEGWRHTSDIWKYELRLAVFALISQVPYSLFLGAQGNVLITLLLGLILLHLRTAMGNRAAWWVAVVAVTVVSGACDWGIVGVIMILVAALAPTKRQQALLSAALPMAGFGIPSLIEVAAGGIGALPALLYAIGNGIAGLLLCAYSGKRGRPLKWFFYAYYPAHIAVLGAAHLILHGAGLLP